MNIVMELQENMKTWVKSSDLDTNWPINIFKVASEYQFSFI